MKTIKSFVEQSHIDASLIRAVIRQAGGWDSFKEIAKDVCDHGADCGFSGFIYYNETVPFAKRNKKAILAYAEEMAKDVGDADEFVLIAGFNCLDISVSEVAEAIYNPRSEHRTEVFNAMAWFTLEEVCHCYANLIYEE